jgi:hypothetical protein
MDDGAGLAEAVQVMPPCSTILIRGGYYKWQLGGMPSHQTVAFHEADEFFYGRELEGDPILVPYPLTFAGENRGGGDAPLLATTYDTARTPNVTAFVHGQWLLTALSPTGVGALWKPVPDVGTFDNLFFLHRTCIRPSVMVEARGGHWAFARCQLRAADGGVPLALYHDADATAEDSAIGGIALWHFEAGGGALLYESSHLSLMRCTVEWVRFAGEGVRVWDRASVRALQCCFQYNGVDVGFNLAANVSLTNCQFRGSELGALWAMSNLSPHRCLSTPCWTFSPHFFLFFLLSLWAMSNLSPHSWISVVGCRFFGEVWRQDLGPDQPDPDQPSQPPEQRAGTVEWKEVSQSPVVARPRTWRPLCKRHPSFWVCK